MAPFDSSSSWIFAIDEIPQAFADITPVDVGVEIENGVAGVAAINYSDDYRVAFGYLRALLRQGSSPLPQQQRERSERALKLTATCLQQNAYNYTVWHYRRECLDAVYANANAKDDGGNNSNMAHIQADLELAATLGGINPKNYQVWYHRRALLERLGSSSGNSNITNTLLQDYVPGELDYVGTVLQVDAKNIHAWSYRQWVVVTINQDDIWTSELDYTHSLLQRDGRNNSAWNHRWFVTYRGAKASKSTKPQSLTAKMAQTEMLYALNAITKDPYNESPWVYYLAIIKEQVYRLQDAAQVIDLLTSCQAQVEAIRHNHLVPATASTSGETLESTYLLGALVDIAEWMGSAESLDAAVAIATSLATQHDTIRHAYWQHRIQGIRQRQQQQQQT